MKALCFGTISLKLVAITCTRVVRGFNLLLQLSAVFHNWVMAGATNSIGDIYLRTLTHYLRLPSSIPLDLFVQYIIDFYHQPPNPTGHNTHNVLFALSHRCYCHFPAGVFLDACSEIIFLSTHTHTHTHTHTCMLNLCKKIRKFKCNQTKKTASVCTLVKK